MDYTNWSNGYSYLVNTNTNNNNEYLKFLEESGTDLGLESFANSRKSKKSKSKSKKSSKSKSKKSSKSKSKKSSKSKSKKSKKSKKSSKSKSKKSKKSKSKKSKKSKSKKSKSKKSSKGKSKKSKKSKKVSRKPIPALAFVTPPINYTAPSINYTTPSLNYTAPPTNFTTPSINYTAPPTNFTAPPTNFTAPPTNFTAPPQNNSGYISLPTLSNQTTTTNPVLAPATVMNVPKPIPSGPILKLNPVLSYRVTDSNGSRFPSSTQIILDSREPILHSDGPKFVSILPATGPTVGSTINGPFVPFGTTVTAVQTIGTIPSDSSIPAQVITISQPLINVSEKTGDVFTFIFTKDVSSRPSSLTDPRAPASLTDPNKSSAFQPDPTLLYRISDNGYTATGLFATHFPTSTQIVLDSRVAVFDANGNAGPGSAKAALPKVGSPIKGPFIQPGTTVVKVEETPTMPSNPYVGGTYITISQPIVGMKEDRGEVFVYTFPLNFDGGPVYTPQPPITAPIPQPPITAPIPQPPITAPIPQPPITAPTIQTPITGQSPTIVQFVEDPKLIYRASDTGYNTQGTFATHFPSSTKIILDSRKPIFNSSGNITNFGSSADSPLIGSLISGPFVKPNTTVVSVQNSGRLSSNSYVDGQTITISQPLENIAEDRGQVFIYTFTKNESYVTPAPTIQTPTTPIIQTPTTTPTIQTPTTVQAPAIAQFVEDPKLIYRVTDTGYNTQGTFVTHFPSSTKIILDSRKPIFNSSGNITNFGSTAFPPPIGSLISGPFVKPNTTVISVDDSGRLPSNSYVDGQTITISQPLENIAENRGQVFIYTFTRPDFSNMPMVGGPCMTNRENWDNDRWVQCTGKPNPAARAPIIGVPNPFPIGPCGTDRSTWDNDRWVQCTGEPNPAARVIGRPGDNIASLGPCGTDRSIWNNDRWVQCTGNPAPAPAPDQGQLAGLPPGYDGAGVNPCSTDRSKWDMGKWLQCTGNLPPTPASTPAPSIDASTYTQNLGGPCMTNPANWDNERWIQCTGKPRP